jgi:transcriptional regulator with XRE-family HTH domain
VPDEPWLSSPASSELELNTDLLGEVLREYRRANKINQADLAQLLHLDQSFVSKIETGKRRVTDIEMLLRLSSSTSRPPVSASRTSCYARSPPRLARDWSATSIQWP